MIQLIGSVNGEDISFYLSPPDTYIATINKNLSGRYVIQLKAVDGAGNTSSYTEIYTYIDFNSMECIILDDTYSFSEEQKKDGFIKVDSKYLSSTLDDKYCFKNYGSVYHYKELV